MSAQKPNCQQSEDGGAPSGGEKTPPVIPNVEISCGYFYAEQNT